MSNAERRARKQANKAQARAARHQAWRQARRRRRLAQILALAVVVALVATMLTLFFGDDGSDVAVDTTDTTEPAEDPEPTTTTALPTELAGVECTDDAPEAPGSPATFDEPEQVIDPGTVYRATMVTSCGEIVFEMDPSDPEVSQAGVNNFVFLARQGFYDGLTFHRVVGDFVIQGGDPEGTGTGGPGYDFGGPDDVAADLTYEIGDLAYANSSGPETSGSQFFVITGANGAALPPNYIKFGTILEGLQVAQRLERFEEPGTQAPSRPLHIFSVTVEEA